MNHHKTLNLQGKEFEKHQIEDRKERPAKVEDLQLNKPSGTDRNLSVSRDIFGQLG